MTKRLDRSDRGVLASVDSWRRVQRALNRLDNSGRGSSAPPIRTAFDEGDEDPHRLCKTTAAFNKGTVATLNIWEDGTPPNETQTSGATVENVVNKYANIASGKWVSVARHGNGRWYVVSAECS